MCIECPGHQESASVSESAAQALAVVAALGLIGAAYAVFQIVWVPLGVVLAIGWMRVLAPAWLRGAVWRLCRSAVAAVARKGRAGATAGVVRATAVTARCDAVALPAGVEDRALEVARAPRQIGSVPAVPVRARGRTGG